MPFYLEKSVSFSDMFNIDVAAEGHFGKGFTNTDDSFKLSDGNGNM